MKFIENFNVELKEILTPDLKKEVVAFANTHDGGIYIGVDNNGNVVGLENPDETIERASAYIRNSIKPDLSMFVNLKIEEIENKKIVVIKIQRGVSRPYYIYEKGLKPTGVYIRQGNFSIPASEEYIREMIKETDGNSFENLRSLNQNLTFKYAEKFFKKCNIDFDKNKMRNLGIIAKDDLYTNLALLISDNCIYSIKIAVFNGLDKEEFNDRKEFKGSILKQVEEVFEYINLVNNKTASFEGLFRKDERDYPIEAIREALLNAVIHRDYSFSGSTLINIYEDRIEFLSLGGLVNGLSLEAIMMGISQSRNEKLSNIFYRLNLIEAYGTGIQKILNSYMKYNQKPIFKTATGAFLVVLPNIHRNKKVKNINLTESQQKVIDNLKNEDMTRKELEESMNLGQTRIINLLKELQELNLVEKYKNGKNIRYKLIN